MKSMNNQLNEAQRKAVESTSKVILCLAGAGTGKTSTLTNRIAYLQEQRVSCSNMLALTFTRLAGKEMKERVIQLVGESEGKNLFCNTFHAFCLKVLKEWGYLIGYDKDFTIYDQEDRESILRVIINEFKYDAHPDEVIDYLNGFFNVKAKNYMDVKGAGDEYKNRLLRNDAIDLDGLLIYALKLINKYPKVQQQYNSLYEYVFVDEFQDSNDIQMQLIKTLNPKNLFVVGDDFQSIYGWRNAKPEYIINFEKYYPGCEVIKLEENYRSTAPIITAANNLIAHNENQTKKELRANKDGPDIEYIVAKNISNECNLVCGKVLEGGSYSDYAVLTRTNKQMDPFIQAFKIFNIPFQVISNKGDPLGKYDVRMILNVMEVVLNPKDDATLKKIINFPERRLSELQLQEIEKYQVDESISLMEALKSRENITEIQEFISQLNDIYKYITEENSKAPMVFYITQNILSLREKYTQEKRNNKIQDIELALEIIERWASIQQELGESTDISSFLKWMHIKDIQEKLIEQKDAVKLMTVHSSKGLEFKKVFVVGLNKNVFPSKRGYLQEERRLLYVAITRAKDKLYLSRSKKALGWGNREILTQESQFLNEIKN